MACRSKTLRRSFFFFQAEDGIRVLYVTGVQTCALPISLASATNSPADGWTVILTEVAPSTYRSEEHTSELQSRRDLVCRLLLEKKKLGSTGAGVVGGGEVRGGVERVVGVRSGVGVVTPG